MLYGVDIYKGVFPDCAGDAFTLSRCEPDRFVFVEAVEPWEAIQEAVSAYQIKRGDIFVIGDGMGIDYVATQFDEYIDVTSWDAAYSEPLCCRGLVPLCN